AAGGRRTGDPGRQHPARGRTRHLRLQPRPAGGLRLQPARLGGTAEVAAAGTAGSGADVGTGGRLTGCAARSTGAGGRAYSSAAVACTFAAATRVSVRAAMPSARVRGCPV